MAELAHETGQESFGWFTMKYDKAHKNILLHMYASCIFLGLFMYYIWVTSMHINLTPEMENYLQSKVGTGFYNNASEVVRDAIRRMWAEDEKLEKLRAAVQIGEEQLERGEGTPYATDRLKTITDKVLNSEDSQ
jgi:antitoxin ParD1/3/4